MLMGTYQPIASLKHISCLDGNLKLCGDNAQPWKPEELDQAWCFPASTWKEAFLHSLFTSPNCPQALILLDTDKYRRIDKARHYALFMEAARRGQYHLGEDAIDATEDPDCPDDRSELLVEPEELDKAVAIYVFHPALQEKNGEGRMLIRHGDSFRSPSIMGVPPEIRKKIAAIRERIASRGIRATGNATDAEAMAKLLFEPARFQFMFTWLPLMYEMIRGEGMIPMDLGIPVMDCFDWLMDCCNRMSDWGLHSCDPGTYMEIMADARLPLDLPDGFDIRAETGRMPGRNDPCFWGSGKKFKKCHAKIFN